MSSSKRPSGVMGEVWRGSPPWARWGWVVLMAAALVAAAMTYRQMNDTPAVDQPVPTSTAVEQ